MLHFKAAYTTGSPRGNQEQTALNRAQRAFAHYSLRGMFMSPFRFPQHLHTGIGLLFTLTHSAPEKSPPGSIVHLTTGFALAIQQVLDASEVE